MFLLSLDEISRVSGNYCPFHLSFKNWHLYLLSLAPLYCLLVLYALLGQVYALQVTPILCGWLHPGYCVCTFFLFHSKKSLSLSFAMKAIRKLLSILSLIRKLSSLVTLSSVSLLLSAMFYGPSQMYAKKMIQLLVCLSMSRMQF